MQARRYDPGFSDPQSVPIPGNVLSSSHVSLNVVGKHWRIFTASGSLYESTETNRPTFYGPIKMRSLGANEMFGGQANGSEVKSDCYTTLTDLSSDPQDARKRPCTVAQESGTPICVGNGGQTQENPNPGGHVGQLIQLRREPVSNKTQREDTRMRLSSHLHTGKYLHSYTGTCRHICKHQIN